MELRVLNHETLAENYRKTNNEHGVRISFLNFNLKLSYLFQFTDSRNDCVANDKWSA